jgi:hypothetical protein
MDSFRVTPRGHFNNAGVDKPRGLENALLQHERKRALPSPATTAPSSDTIGPAAVVSLRGDLRAPAGDGANVHVNARGDDAGSGSLIVGDGANVHINTRGDATGSGSLIVGDGANVHINTRGDATGSGSLIVGDGANVHINARGDATGSGSLIVGDGANVHINTRAEGPGSAETLVRVNERDEFSVPTAPGEAEAPRSIEEAAELGLRERRVRAAELHPSRLPSIDVGQTLTDPSRNDRDRVARDLIAPSGRSRGASAKHELPAYTDPRLRMMRELIDSVRQGWDERAAKESKAVDEAKPPKETREVTDATAGTDGKGADATDGRAARTVHEAKDAQPGPTSKLTGRRETGGDENERAQKQSTRANAHG